MKPVSRFDTTRDVWLKLEKSHASKLRAKAIHNKELQGLKKGEMSIKDYILKVKLLTDELKLA